MAGWMSGWKGGWVEGWLDGEMDGRIDDEWVRGQVDGLLLSPPLNPLVQLLGTGMLSLTGLNQEALSRLFSGMSYLHTLLMLCPEQTASSFRPLHPSSPCCTLQPTSSATLLQHPPFQAFSKEKVSPKAFLALTAWAGLPTASTTPQSSARAPMPGAERVANKQISG